MNIRKYTGKCDVCNNLDRFADGIELEYNFTTVDSLDGEKPTTHYIYICFDCLDEVR